MAFTKNVLLTFDYELFQGKRSGSVENCMLLPTEKILSLLKKHKATAIFFIDMLYLCRLKELEGKSAKAKRDFELIEQQIIEIAKNGHYVFNHLHPHWLDAVYDKEKNDWTLTNDSKYSFQSLRKRSRPASPTPSSMHFPSQRPRPFRPRRWLVSRILSPRLRLNPWRGHPCPIPIRRRLPSNPPLPMPQLSWPWRSPGAIPSVHRSGRSLRARVCPC